MSRRPSRFKSDLNYLIYKHLTAAGIEIPNPQRDLHIRSGVLKVENVTDTGSGVPGSGLVQSGVDGVSLSRTFPGGAEARNWQRTSGKTLSARRRNRHARGMRYPEQSQPPLIKVRVAANWLFSLVRRFGPWDFPLRCQLAATFRSHVVRQSPFAHRSSKLRRDGRTLFGISARIIAITRSSKRR